MNCTGTRAPGTAYSPSPGKGIPGPGWYTSPRFRRVGDDADQVEVSPNGKLIAFNQGETFVREDLRVMTAWGRDVHTVFRSSETAYTISWLPDSRPLVFALGDPAIEMYVAKIYGKSARRIFRQPLKIGNRFAGIEDIEVDPSGTMLAVSAAIRIDRHTERPLRVTIWLMHSDGSNVRTLRIRRRASWTSDGLMLLHWEPAVDMSRWERR